MFRCMSDGLRCYSGADLGYLIESCGSTSVQVGLVRLHVVRRWAEGESQGTSSFFSFCLVIPIIYRLLAIYLLYSRRLLLAEFQDA